MGNAYVDASTYQPALDVAAYKAAGYSRIAHRATFRDTGTDDRFVGRWPTFTGLTRQSYHFAYEGDDPTRAMQHHVDVVESVGGWNPGDEVMLDLEWFQVNGSWIGLDPVHARAYAHAFLDPLAESHPNIRRFIYANSWYVEAAGITAAEFPNVGLIIASYGSGYRTPAGFSHSCIWQYTSTATVPGFPGEQVDCNTMVCPYGLAHLTYGGDVPLTPDDLTQITAIVRGAVSDGAVLVGKKIDNVTGTIMGNDPGQPDADPTHYSIGDIGRNQRALPAQVGSAVASGVQAAVEQAVAHISPNIDPTMLDAAIAEAVGRVVPQAVQQALAGVKGELTFGGQQ